MSLIPNQKYVLKYSDQFCHLVSPSSLNYDRNFLAGIYTFVGTVDTASGRRNIFFKESTTLKGERESHIIANATIYVMFGADKVDYIVPLKDSIMQQIDQLNVNDNKLEEISKILNR